MRYSTRGVAAIVFACALCFAAPVFAVPDFSRLLREELGLEQQPSCTFCHARKAGGLATDTAFGAALKDRGFARKEGVSSLRAALRALDEQGIDSDGDGMADVEELRSEGNPNDASDAGRPPVSCSVGGRGPNRAAQLATIAPLAILLLRRRARRPARDTVVQAWTQRFLRS